MRTYFKTVGILGVIVLAVLLGVLSWHLSSLNKTMADENSTLSKKLQLANTAPTLPATAVKVSECVPFMGEHWVAPSDIPNGPFYMVDKGKILGIEYMFGLDEIPGEPQAKMTKDQFLAYLDKNHFSLGDVLKFVAPTHDMGNMRLNSFSFEWSSPHAGQPRPHYDIHFYTATPAELSKICPDAKVQDIDTPEVIDNIKKYNIPFPGINDKKK